MNFDLTGKTVAILVADGFEQVELTKPKKALEKAGAMVEIVSPNYFRVKGVHHGKPGDSFKVDVRLKRADPSEYDALVLPGGLMNPDELRSTPEAVKFVKAFFTAHKPVAAICHGPWTLINAGVVKGRTMTSYESIQIDLKNAGANWVNREVVVDNGLVTSRKPSDLPAFNKKMIEEIAEGKHLAKAA